MIVTQARCRRRANPQPRRPVYLDNHATTPMDPLVLKRMLPFFCKVFGNAGSATHSYGWEAREAVEHAREQIADLLGANQQQIVFTSGATESNNLAIKGFAAASDRVGHIITQATEHKCVLETARRLGNEGWKVTVLPVDRFGRVDPDNLRRAIRPDTMLVSIMAANNEVGTIQPIREIATICQRHGIVMHTDAAQAVGKTEIDWNAVPVDMLSLSGHKIYGPKGIGALAVRRDGKPLKLRRILDGGDQEFGLRAGTLPVPLIAGLGSACERCAVNRPAESSRIERQRDRLWQGIRAEIDDVVLNGHPTERLAGNLNVSFPGVDHVKLMTNLDGLAISTGSACNSARLTPSYVLTAMGVPPDLALSTIRFGLGRFTTDDEVEYAIETVVDAVRRSQTPS
jgi:cysteine desulfurase